MYVEKLLKGRVINYCEKIGARSLEPISREMTVKKARGNVGRTKAERPLNWRKTKVSQPGKRRIATGLRVCVLISDNLKIRVSVK